MLLLASGELRSDARSEALSGGAPVHVWAGEGLAEKFLESHSGVRVVSLELFELDPAFFEDAARGAEESRRRRRGAPPGARPARARGASRADRAARGRRAPLRRGRPGGEEDEGEDEGPEETGPEGAATPSRPRAHRANPAPASGSGVAAVVVAAGVGAVSRALRVHPVDRQPGAAAASGATPGGQEAAAPGRRALRAAQPAPVRATVGWWAVLPGRVTPEAADGAAGDPAPLLESRVC